MASKRKPPQRRQPEPAREAPAATLKDLLSAEVLDKLKAQAEELKAGEARRREEQRRAQEEARLAEQKRRENDFEYLLNNSGMDWKKYK